MYIHIEREGEAEIDIDTRIHIRVSNHACDVGSNSAEADCGSPSRSLPSYLLAVICSVFRLFIVSIFSSSGFMINIRQITDNIYPGVILGYVLLVVIY